MPFCPPRHACPSGQSCRTSPVSSAGAGEAARHLSPTAPQPADPLHAHSFSRRDHPSTASTALGGDRTTRGLCLPVEGRGRAGSPAGWGSGASEKRALDKSCQERGGFSRELGSSEHPGQGPWGQSCSAQGCPAQGEQGWHSPARPPGPSGSSCCRGGGLGAQQTLQSTRPAGLGDARLPGPRQDGAGPQLQPVLGLWSRPGLRATARLGPPAPRQARPQLPPSSPHYLPPPG